MLTNTELKQIEELISEGEKRTSGEIRVHIDNTCEIDPYYRGIQIFHELKMHKTKERNGVLIYLDFTHKKFAIIGDLGIHEKVGSEFWENTKTELVKEFKNSNFLNGVCNCVEILSDKLSTFFPLKDSDTNELSNEVTTA
jgi:uncharacterized membrane protein